MVNKKLVISTDQNFSIKFLGRNIWTFYNQSIMNLSRSSAVYNCSLDNIECKPMTDETLTDCIGEFSIEYIKTLKNKFSDKFLGLVLYHKGEFCGYICGLMPQSREIQYRIKKCEFFVKYVFVAPEFRGKRIASELFRRLFEKTDARSVTFAVRKNNYSAMKAYLAMGAKVVAKRKFVRFLKVNIPYYSV